MAKKKQKKKLALERERLKTKRAFYGMIAALSIPAAALIDLIKFLLKLLLKK